MAATVPAGDDDVERIARLLAGSGARAIAERLESAVRRGDLAPAAPLPPIRTLAKRIGVDANTVAAAYRIVRDQGIVETAGRAGTRVRARPTTLPRQEIGGPVPPSVLDLASGGPDRALLPPLVLPTPAKVLGYEDVRAQLVDGLAPALREQACRVLDAEGVPIHHLTAAGGALDAVERALQAAVRPRARVAIEDPGWANLLDLLPALGLETVPVPVDDEGPLPDALQAAVAGGAEAVVVTARAQNPTGASVGEQRATELREVLAAYPDVLVVEDDHGAGLASAPLHTLAGATRRWVHVRSFSKAYAPDLRVAVVAGDEVTVARLAGRLRLGPGWVSLLMQETAAATWQSAGPAVTHAGAVYDVRRAALFEALERLGVPASGRTGLNVWVPVRDEARAVASLLHSGYAVAPGSRFRLRSGPGVRVTISRLDPGDADRLAGELAACV